MKEKDRYPRNRSLSMLCAVVLVTVFFLGATKVVASAREILGPVVQEAIKKIEKETRKIDIARKKYRQEIVSLEEKWKKLESKLSDLNAASPEMIGKTEAEFLGVAVRLNNHDMALAKETLKGLETIAPAMERLQEVMRREGGAEGVEKSVKKMRTMVKGLLQVGSRILIATNFPSEKNAKVKQVENTLLVMQKVYKRVLNPGARASIAVQLETVVHAISATYSQTQALMELLQDERSRLSIANNLALSRLLALKMARLGGEVKGIGVGLEHSAERITSRSKTLDRMISREASYETPGESLSSNHRIKEMANGRVYLEDDSR